MTTLDSTKPGQGGIIWVAGGQGVPRGRLLDMGLTPRMNVHINEVAPMGDPMELNLGGYAPTLRLENAAKTEIGTEGVK